MKIKIEMVREETTERVTEQREEIEMMIEEKKGEDMIQMKTETAQQEEEILKMIGERKVEEPDMNRKRTEIDL